MTLTSYAQNFEDILLWRALGHVEQGFYVDVGAQHPRVDSVSQLFHEKGWRGIHIEPSTAYAELLRAQRPGDEVIEAALSAERGQSVFHEIRDTGLSTLAQAAMEAAASRGFEVSDRPVRTMLLDDVLAGIDGPIHWLKIDVEGHERSVIDGWNGTARPWVLLIESTLPGSHDEAYQDWEEKVLAKGYHFVWFDGLNRFYVHDDHAELDAYFGRPPNVFDGFALSGEATSSFANGLTARLDGLERALREQADAAAEKLDAAERASADQVAAIGRQAVQLADAAAEKDALTRRLADEEQRRVEQAQGRARIEAAFGAVVASHADEITRMWQDRERIERERDEIGHRLDGRQAALEAALRQGAKAERDAALAAARIEETRMHQRAEADRERVRFEAEMRALRAEHRAALGALSEKADRVADEAAALHDRLLEASAALAEAREGERAAQVVRADERLAHAVLLADARAELRDTLEENARNRSALKELRARLFSLAADPSLVDESPIESALDAVEAIVSAYRSRLAELDAVRHCSGWKQIGRALGLSQGGRGAPIDVFPTTPEPSRDTSEQNLFEQRSTGISPVRSFRSFWSRDMVADRVDSAVATLAAQLQMALEQGFAGVGEEMQQLRARCDTIVRSAEGIAPIGASVSRLMSAADHLTDIGMATIQQTATIQQWIEPAAEEEEQGVETDGVAGVEAQLSPAERQIFDNFARAKHAL